MSNLANIDFSIRSNRTGSNIKVGIHDSGGTTTEITPNITSADVFQSVSWDISGVSNANKDAIDQIIITIVNASAANTFYIDNIIANEPSLNDTVTLTTSAIDLSGINTLTYWVRSDTTGSFARFQFGESVSSEQTNVFTITSADTWEKKTWDISGITETDRDTVTKFAFEITADTSGAVFYFDDITSSEPPLTPTLDSPTDTDTGVPTTAVLKTTATDPNGNNIQYKIELCENLAMTTNCQTFNQVSSQTGWSGQDGDGGTTYTSGTQGTYTLQTPLSPNSVYYWRSYAIDPAGTNTFGPTQVTPYSFTTNQVPNVPTLDSPSTASLVSTTPVLTLTATDPEADNIQYKIELCEDVGMSVSCQTFNQASSQTGWSGQNGDGGTTYTSGTQGTYTVQSALTKGLTYYWRGSAIDPAGSNTFGSTSSVINFIVNQNPTEPTILHTDSSVNPVDVINTTPAFSALCNDPDTGDVLNKYRILVDDDSDFSSAVWDSGAAGTSMANCTAGNRSSDIVFGGTPLTIDGTTYYWKIKFWDNIDLEGAWSTESATFTMYASVVPTTCTIQEDPDDLSLTLSWTDNSIIETQYRIERNVSAAGFLFLINKAADSQSHEDTGVSQGNTYQYRVRAENGTNTDWCTTSTLTLGAGTFELDGLNFQGVDIQ